MLFARTRPIPHRRALWLLCFGLLLVLAQAAASVHAISHIGTDGGRSRDGSSLIHAQCDLCLLGATIGGAAPLAETPAPQRADLGHVLAADDGRTSVASVPLHAYRSRAPPAASR